MTATPTRMPSLVAERRAVSAQVADLEAELVAIVTAAATVPPDDEHDAEGSTVGYERARVTALLGRARWHLAELDEAAARRRADRYGVCEGCGNPIPAERLAARPAARTCVACASAGGPAAASAALGAPASSLRGGRPARSTGPG